MFIKSLIIKTPNKIIRQLDFKRGLNLIVDNTPSSNTVETGNSVGKTTVLKLIDFCLGAKQSIVYSDTENKKATYELVEEFLINNEVEIVLVLSEDLDDPYARKIEICRNFLKYKKAKRAINGTSVQEKDFDNELRREVLADNALDKPTFRQIISHCIRYKDEHINNTLRTLDSYTSDVEYEALYLFLLGCTSDFGAQKIALTTKLQQESAYKSRLEKKQTKNSYEVTLSLVNEEIEKLQYRKNTFNLNPNFAEDLNKINGIKLKVSEISTLLSRLELRKSIIIDAQRKLDADVAVIDISQLRSLYEEVNINISNIQKTFEELVEYHNKMVKEKSRFITAELPELDLKISNLKKQLQVLLEEERQLSELVKQKETFEELEKIISELNTKYKLKGEYETVINQINDVESNIEALQKELAEIDSAIYSKEYQENLIKQITKFNRYYSGVSQMLYGEQYVLTYEIVINKNGRKVYKFNSISSAWGTGKKQGEVLCFDLAYTFFADNEGISTLHFLLNDKKELMHDNQLVQVAEYIRNKDVQLIVSILKDKLPIEVIEKSHTVVELSQKEKLFKIENNVI